MIFVVALIAVAAVASPSYAQCTNLLINPGFEDGGGSYTSWFTFGTGPQISTPADDNIARTGIAAAKIFGEGSGCPTPQFDVGGFGQTFTPTAGMIYELSGYSYMSSSDAIPGSSTCDGNRLVAQIAFFDLPVGGNVLARNDIVVGDYSTITDQWNEFYVTTVAPTGAQRVEAIFLFLQPGCDTGSVYVDDVVFCESSPPTVANLLTNPSFDTGLNPDWKEFGNAWADTRVFATRTPIGSAKLFGTFTPDNDSGFSQRVAATPGTEYQFDVHAMTTCEETPINEGNDNVVVAQLKFLDVVGAEISFVDTVIVDSTSIVGNWAKYSLTATAPTGTDSAEVFILFVQQPTTLMSGAAWVDDLALFEVEPTGIRPGQSPDLVKLHQNVPNPFNPTTTITFTLPTVQNARVEIFDAAGRSVRVLYDGAGSPGVNTVNWDGTNASGNQVASGAYFYKLTSGSFQETRKMVLLK